MSPRSSMCACSTRSDCRPGWPRSRPASPMAGDQATAALTGGVALLERAIAYTQGSLHLVTPDALDRRTPCRLWNLRALLDHGTDSMLTLAETVTEGRIGPTAVALNPPFSAD